MPPRLVALLTIGALLERSQINSTQCNTDGSYVPAALIKLVVHPLLVAALPSASNVALLAERFGADDGRIARIILLSKVLALFSFSAAVALLT